MNGNWGGIASQDFERPNRHIEGLEDPSLDVINTIVSSQSSGVYHPYKINYLDSIICSIGY